MAQLFGLLHRDKQWLDDKMFAAQSLAAEINGTFDQMLLDPEDGDEGLDETG